MKSTTHSPISTRPPSRPARSGRAQRCRCCPAFGALCTAIALLVPMAKYQNFLLLIGSVFAPLFGVVLVDHFIVRKRRIEADVLGDVRGRYGFSGGWHLSAFISWAIGIVAYQAINQWLPNLGATLPALVIGAVCYLALVSTRKTAYA